MNKNIELPALVDKIMEQAQVFASAWSLVGGPFDSGVLMEQAGEAKHELRSMVADALAAQQRVLAEQAVPATEQAEAATASNAERMTDEQATALWQKHLRLSDEDGYSIHGGLELVRAVEAVCGIPKGMVLAPLEPTDEMEVAAENAYEESGSAFPNWKTAYRSMIAAAPTEASKPVQAEAAKTPGMAVMGLAGEIVAALLADENDGGYDLEAGLFGPAFSTLVRRWADAEWRATQPPAIPAGEREALEAEIERRGGLDPYRVRSFRDGWEARAALASKQEAQCGQVLADYLNRFMGKGAGIVRRFYNNEDQSVVDAGAWIQEANQLLQLLAATPATPAQAEQKPTAQQIADYLRGLDGMVAVKAVDANNYCRVLAALGLEEEGDPVAAIEDLKAAVHDAEEAFTQPEPEWPDVSPAGLRKMAEIAAPNNGRVFNAAADVIEGLQGGRVAQDVYASPIFTLAIDALNKTKAWRDCDGNDGFPHEVREQIDAVLMAYELRARDTGGSAV
jgi:hypothetical protein